MGGVTLLWKIGGKNATLGDPRYKWPIVSNW